MARTHWVCYAGLDLGGRQLLPETLGELGCGCDGGLLHLITSSLSLAAWLTALPLATTRLWLAQGSSLSSTTSYTVFLQRHHTQSFFNDIIHSLSSTTPYRVFLQRHHTESFFNDIIRGLSLGVINN
jgi:hypothetical protein